MPLLKFNTSHIQSLSVKVYMSNIGKSYQDISSDIFAWNGVRHFKEANDFDKFQDDVLSFALGRGF